jgi:uncharacterized membrane protein YkvA (DUF1232 family)
MHHPGGGGLADGRPEAGRSGVDSASAYTVSGMGLAKWKQRAKELKREVYALYLACGDRRTPWYAKALGACVVAYALSPLDLIPDPIPVLGYLDDLVLLPAGVLLVRRLIPPHVLAECRQKAEAAGEGRPRNWVAGGIIIALWVATLAALGWWLWRLLR